MKTIKLTLIALMSALTFSLSSEAQNYLCSGNNIKFSVSTADLAEGNVVEWYWDEAGTSAVAATDAGVEFLTVGGVVNAEVRFTGSASTSFTTDSLTAVEKKIYAKVMSGLEDACSADSMQMFSVVVLPVPTIATIGDINATYCTNNPLEDQTIAATLNTIAGLPEGVTFNFEWTLAQGTETPVSVGAGAVVGSTSTLTYISPLVAGTYTYNVTASYNITEGWVGSSCTSVSASDEFTVTPAPVTPAISVGTF